MAERRVTYEELTGKRGALIPSTAVKVRGLIPSMAVKARRILG
jgi:hypothetical protein